jgi:hypothetical protein
MLQRAPDQPPELKHTKRSIRIATKQNRATGKSIEPSTSEAVGSISANTAVVARIGQTFVDGKVA